MKNILLEHSWLLLYNDVDALAASPLIYRSSVAIHLEDLSCSPILPTVRLYKLVFNPRNVRDHFMNQKTINLIYYT